MKRCFICLMALVLAVMVFAASAGAFTYFNAGCPDDWEARELEDGSVMFENGNNWIYVVVVDALDVIAGSMDFGASDGAAASTVMLVWVHLRLWHW